MYFTPLGFCDYTIKLHKNIGFTDYAIKSETKFINRGYFPPRLNGTSLISVRVDTDIVS